MSVYFYIAAGAAAVAFVSWCLRMPGAFTAAAIAVSIGASQAVAHA